jgi:hypothetical protein
MIGGLEVVLSARRPADRRVRALHEVSDFQDLRFGRATQAKRRPGARNGRLVGGREGSPFDALIEPVRERPRGAHPFGRVGR